MSIYFGCHACGSGDIAQSAILLCATSRAKSLPEKAPKLSYPSPVLSQLRALPCQVNPVPVIKINAGKCFFPSKRV